MLDDRRLVSRSWWCIREATGGDGRVCDLGWTRLGEGGRGCSVARLAQNSRLRTLMARSSRTTSCHHSRHCCQAQAHFWGPQHDTGRTGAAPAPAAAATGPLAMEEGAPSKRSKKELTEFDKLDAVTKWSMETLDLRWDADKNSAEATAAMAKYNECAARLHEQGHAHPDITELNTLTKSAPG